METLSTISGGLTAYLLASVLPAVLSLLGLIVAMVFGAYGALMVYAQLSGKTSKDVFYKLGRVFGEEIYDNEYQNYKSKRRRREREDSFRRRYDRE